MNQQQEEGEEEEEEEEEEVEDIITSGIQLLGHIPGKHNDHWKYIAIFYSVDSLREAFL